MPRNNSSTPGAGPDFSSLWLKRVLLPFLIFRLVVMKLFAIVYIIVIIALSRGSKNYGTAIALAVVFLVVTLVFIALDLISVFSFIRRRLNPLTFLIFNSIETVVWAVLFGLQVYRNISANRSGHGPSGSALAWLFSFVILLACVGLLIYAIVVYVRYRKTVRRGRYAPADAPTAAEAGVQQGNVPVGEAYDTPMQVQYPGGGAYEFYRPQKSSGSHDRARDFTAATDGLMMNNYQGNFYAPGAAPSTAYLGAAGAHNKSPDVDIAEQPLEHGSHIR